MIHDIEELSAKLSIEPIRNPLDVVILEHREIHIKQSGSDDHIAAQVAANVGTRGGRQSWAETSARAVAISRVGSGQRH